MVRKLSLMVAAGSAIVAFAGAGTAQAAPGAACKVNTSPCPAGQAYSGYFGAALNASAGPAVLTTSIGQISCNKSDGYGAITTNRQAAPDNIKGYLYNISFSQNGGRCPTTIALLGNPFATVQLNDNNGSLRGKWNVGASVNATGTGGEMRFYEPSVTITLWNAQSGGSAIAQCTYTAPQIAAEIRNTDRSLRVTNATLSGAASPCPSSGTYTARYTTFGSATGASGGAHIPLYVVN